mmetsp:Transcript_35983/g.101914  ORF Transcript_35983/g.101914 Transcript_35983/m.101914 type:complete len:216 (+) Transcript_35983:1942-2589(+)
MAASPGHSTQQRRLFLGEYSPVKPAQGTAPQRLHKRQTKGSPPAVRGLSGPPTGQPQWWLGWPPPSAALPYWWSPVAAGNGEPGGAGASCRPIPREWRAHGRPKGMGEACHGRSGGHPHANILRHVPEGHELHRRPADSRGGSVRPRPGCLGPLLPCVCPPQGHVRSQASGRLWPALVNGLHGHAATHRSNVIRLPPPDPATTPDAATARPPCPV